jgi:hypothetical protein
MPTDPLRSRLLRDLTLTAPLLIALMGLTTAVSATANVSVGRLLWAADVDATGRAKYEATLRAGQSVVVVVTGYFVYSRDGRQDARYRWHEGRNDVHSPCAMHLKGKEYSFVIDGHCATPSHEDFPNHAYVYFRTVPPDGRTRLEINDNKYGDNRGSLRVEIYERP